MRHIRYFVPICLFLLAACSDLPPDAIDARAAQIAVPLIATHNAAVSTRTIAPTPTAIPTQPPTDTPPPTRTPPPTPYPTSTRRPTSTPGPAATATRPKPPAPTRTAAPTQPPPPPAEPLRAEWSETSKSCQSKNEYIVTFEVRAFGGTPPYSFFRDLDQIGGPTSSNQITYSLTWGEGSAAVGTFIVVDSAGQRAEIKFFVKGIKC
jgi:hypothetical protein